MSIDKQFAKLQESQRVRGELFTKLQKESIVMMQLRESNYKYEKEIERLKRDFITLNQESRRLIREKLSLEHSISFRTGKFFTCLPRKNAVTW